LAAGVLALRFAGRLSDGFPGFPLLGIAVPAGGTGRLV